MIAPVIARREMGILLHVVPGAIEFFAFDRAVLGHEITRFVLCCHVGYLLWAYRTLVRFYSSMRGKHVARSGQKLRREQAAGAQNTPR